MSLAHHCHGQVSAQRRRKMVKFPFKHRTSKLHILLLPAAIVIWPHCTEIKEGKWGFSSWVPLCLAKMWEFTKEWVNKYWRIPNLSPLTYFIIALLFSVVTETLFGLPWSWSQSLFSKEPVFYSSLLPWYWARSLASKEHSVPVYWLYYRLYRNFIFFLQ